MVVLEWIRLSKCCHQLWHNRLSFFFMGTNENSFKGESLAKHSFLMAWLELTDKQCDSSQPSRDYFTEIMNLEASISHVFHVVPDLHSTVRQLNGERFF